MKNGNENTSIRRITSLRATVRNPLSPASVAWIPSARTSAENGGSDIADSPVEIPDSPAEPLAEPAFPASIPAEADPFTELAATAFDPQDVPDGPTILRNLAIARHRRDLADGARINLKHGF
ncbi:MAG: hypothetical protein WD069_01360 [Planctomycetales bacterium]